MGLAGPEANLDEGGRTTSATLLRLDLPLASSSHGPSTAVVSSCFVASDRGTDDLPASGGVLDARKATVPFCTNISQPNVGKYGIQEALTVDASSSLVHMIGAGWGPD